MGAECGSGGGDLGATRGQVLMEQGIKREARHVFVFVLLVSVLTFITSFFLYLLFYSV
jgi:hypothetical protein